MIQRGIATFTLDYGKCPQNYSRIKNKIPKEPQIPLKNYLLDLISESDNKKSSIYLIGVEKFIKEIWEEITRHNPRTLKVKVLIPQNFRIHHMTFYHYKNGKKAIPLQILYKLLELWKQYCPKNNREFKRKWEEIYRSNFYFSSSRRYPLIIPPKYINPQLSYLIGWICGDGNFNNYNNHYLIKISEKSIIQLNYILSPLFNILFNAQPKLYHIYKGGYALQLNSKPVFRFFTQVLKIRVGEIPELVFNLDEINKRYFLAGVFDSEGFVSKNRYKITISQAKIEFLVGLLQLFSLFKIKFNGPTQHTTKLGTWYSIRLEKKSEIVKFYNIIGSYHVEKLPKIKAMISKIKYL